METNKSPRVVAALNLPTPVPMLIKVGQGIVTAMTNNSHFPSPTPALATVTSDLTVLMAAEVLAGTKAKGAATARNVKLGVVLGDLRQLRNGVQVIADANPSEAASIIQSAGMGVKTIPTRQKQVASVKQGPVSGTVLLLAAVAGRSACYEWQWSADEKTWTSAPSTLRARTTISGLTPNTGYWFRSRTVTHAGESDYIQPLFFFVK